MAFKEVADLSADVTISLGGVSKKTGKANPTKIEGYYLGFREVEDRKKKSGLSRIYTFQTPQGNVGVWGKTDLDRKMNSATVGAMTRVTQNGTTPTPNGPMYKFKVEIDADNICEVASASTAESATAEEYVADYEEASLDDEEALLDEVKVAPPAARGRAQAPSAAQQARVQALLSRKN